MRTKYLPIKAHLLLENQRRGRRAHRTGGGGVMNLWDMLADWVFILAVSIWRKKAYDYEFIISTCV